MRHKKERIKARALIRSFLISAAVGVLAAPGALLARARGAGAASGSRDPGHEAALAPSAEEMAALAALAAVWADR